MAIRTLKEYIESECDEFMIFESSVALSQNMEKLYVIPYGSRPPKEVLNQESMGYFEPVALNRPTDNWREREVVGVPIRQHLEDKVYTKDKTD